MAAITTTATFTAADNVAVTYAGISATTPIVIPGDAIVTSGGPVIVYVDGDPTSTGCTIKASSTFTGTVNLIVIG